MISVTKDGKILMSGAEEELEKEIVFLTAIYLHDCVKANGGNVWNTAVRMLDLAMQIASDDSIYNGGITTTIKMPKIKEREDENE